MFYVSARDDDDDDEEDNDNNRRRCNDDQSKTTNRRSVSPRTAAAAASAASKSSTLRSNVSNGDFDTPPESPPAWGKMTTTKDMRVDDDDNDDDDEPQADEDVDEEEEEEKPEPPPIPPPRTRRNKAAPKRLDNLKLGDGVNVVRAGMSRTPSTQGEESNTVSSDILFAGYASSCPPDGTTDDKDFVRGHLSMLVISAKGLRQVMKVRWFVCDKRLGRLRYYRNEDENDLVGEIDIQSATFCYDVQADRNGEFTVCCSRPQGDHVLSAGTPDRRMYWLQQLQKARREFSHGSSSRNPMGGCQVGLLRSPTDSSLISDNNPNQQSYLGSKDSSPFKEIMQTMERPPTADHFITSPPRSADYYKKPSFFQSFKAGKAHFRMPRSASMRTPSPPPPLGAEQRSPPPSKPVSSPSSSFNALTKIRRSIREKRGVNSSQWTSPKRFAPAASNNSNSGNADQESQIAALKDDLQAAKDEGSASKEVIALLRRQTETLQKEIETLSSLRAGGDMVDDGHLLDILRTKDGQIVDLEARAVESQRSMDLQESQISRCKEEVETYRHLLETKDESIVRLTNQLHEMELTCVMMTESQQQQQQQQQQQGVAAGHPRVEGIKLSSNGLSFDSDKGEFREFIDVASQASLGDKERETLQDTVVAYEMQNKFLNKEVLELNQLRQMAVDREQKLFIEASHWEARFCQIQSKYLFLLNELHNPQVGVSNSRKEMVGQLLKDIVEAAERPRLTTGGSGSNSFDRFGFRIDLEADGSSLEDKAERLRKKAEEQSESFVAELENNSEAKWEETIASLHAKVPFTATQDVKRMLRQGVPISQRGAVWKGIVENKLMRSSSSSTSSATSPTSSHNLFQADYYQMLLANYNPSRNLTPAAKQIELDLLRTLPNNRHYDSPHADGIAKLRRVLLAYSVHNPDVEYCQGFNRIAAIALLFMQEEDAFWLLIYIVEAVMPAEYYSRDKQLIGAQVDQEVLKELLVEMMPRLAAHFEKHQVDPTMFSLNWFLCIFVDNIPVNTYLHIWDSFLFEGSKVLFRYAIAIFKLLEDDLLQQNDYMSIINTLRSEVETLVDVRKLTQIAFKDLNPFPMKAISNKRAQHYKLLEAQRKELDHIRLNYRKNSLARQQQAPTSSSLSRKAAAGGGAAAAATGEHQQQPGYDGVSADQVVSPRNLCPVVSDDEEEEEDEI